MKFYKTGLSIEDHMDRIIEECLIAKGCSRKETAKALGMKSRTLRARIATLSHLHMEYDVKTMKKAVKDVRRKLFDEI